MNIGIMSSASCEIDNKYIEEMDKVASYLAKRGYDLVFGAASYSMMGSCYKAFKKENRTIEAHASIKYKDDLNDLPGVIPYIVEDTFKLKKFLFNKSDIILCMPGGLGALSEILSYIEEKRSNDKDKKIIIYNFEHFYDDLLNLFEKRIEEKFISNEIKNMYIVVSSLDELKNII